MRLLDWSLRLLAAAILAQTLFFKFSGSAESRYIFSRLGVEPWGRHAAGVVELAAVLLLLIPRTAPFGAVLSGLIASGAIGAHLTRLGVSVQNDGGLLFGLAIALLLASGGSLAVRRPELPHTPAQFLRTEPPRPAGR